MIALNEETKAFCSKYVGADGFLVIDDTVPEELREIFQYFNDEGIKILEMNIDDSYNISDDEESGGNVIHSFIDEDESAFEEKSDIDLNNLNDIF